MDTLESDKLTFEYEDNGFCRVIFSRKFEGKKFFYCWMEEVKGTFQFYRCSQDGAYRVNGWGGIPAIDQTPANPGETDTGRALNVFILKNRK
jgi:hypothetical protein